MWSSFIVKFLSVMARSFACRHLFQHVMICSLACHDPFLNMQGSVPTCKDLFRYMSSSVPSFRHWFHHVNISSFASRMVAQTAYFNRSDFLQVRYIVSIFRIHVSLLRCHWWRHVLSSTLWSSYISFYCTEWKRDLSSSSRACHPLFLIMLALEQTCHDPFLNMQGSVP